MPFGGAPGASSGSAASSSILRRRRADPERLKPRRLPGPSSSLTFARAHSSSSSFWIACTGTLQKSPRHTCDLGRRLSLANPLAMGGWRRSQGAGRAWASAEESFLPPLLRRWGGERVSGDLPARPESGATTGSEAERTSLEITAGSVGTLGSVE